MRHGALAQLVLVGRTQQILDRRLVPQQPHQALERGEVRAGVAEQGHRHQADVDRAAGPAHLPEGHGTGEGRDRQTGHEHVLGIGVRDRGGDRRGQTRRVPLLAGAQRLGEVHGHGAGIEQTAGQRAQHVLRVGDVQLGHDHREPQGHRRFAVPAGRDVVRSWI